MNYIKAAELAALIRSQGNLIKVIDVRDDDHVGGNIKGSTHFASEQFTSSKLEELVKDSSKSETVVVHCALSKERGPRMAKLYQDELIKQGGNQKVLVLEDGFVGFQSLYRSDPDLVEKFDKKVWGSFAP